MPLIPRLQYPPQVLFQQHWMTKHLPPYFLAKMGAAPAHFGILVACHRRLRTSPPHIRGAEHEALRICLWSIALTLRLSIIHLVRIPVLLLGVGRGGTLFLAAPNFSVF